MAAAAVAVESHISLNGRKWNRTPFADGNIRHLHKNTESREKKATKQLIRLRSWNVFFFWFFYSHSLTKFQTNRKKEAEIFVCQNIFKILPVVGCCFARNRQNVPWQKRRIRINKDNNKWMRLDVTRVEKSRRTVWRARSLAQQWSTLMKRILCSRRSRFCDGMNECGIICTEYGSAYVRAGRQRKRMSGSTTLRQ